MNAKEIQQSTDIYWSIFGAKWKYISLDRRRRYTYYSLLCYLIQLFDQLQMALDTSQAKPNIIPQSFKRIDKHLWVYAVFYQNHTYSWYRIFYDRTQLLFCFLSNLLIKSIDCFGSKSAQPICPKFVVKYLCKHCWNNARQILSG